MIPSFDVGDRIRLGNASGNNADGVARQAFETLLGVPTDPTMVSLQIIRPDSTELVYNWPSQGAGDGVLDREATGRFYHDLTLDAFGKWRWRLLSTGAVETSDKGELYVRWDAFTVLP
jgi:hypothetical protein